jgi:3'-phosphoadenosine 5'-phosphosulfate sulfotransferase (PAPS reductase)/FAD synthetase
MNETTNTMPDLSSFDFIVINTSAGKDSQCMMDYVVRRAEAEGIKDRVIAVHCDLGKMEWEGTKELAQEHAAHYGIPLHVVRREKGDLLQQVEERGMWPSSKCRYCTSDQKRDQVAKLHTAITAQKIHEMNPAGKPRQIRILNCMGFRADESPARAKKPVLAVDKRTTNGLREVVNWLPIHTWNVERVWSTIKASGVRWHKAYDYGMPRLSCCFCIFAPKDALMIAGQHNPALLDAYVAMEEKIGHSFRHGFKISEVKDALVNGEKPGKVQSWNM